MSVCVCVSEEGRLLRAAPGATLTSQNCNSFQCRAKQSCACFGFLLSPFALSPRGTARGCWSRSSSYHHMSLCFDRLTIDLCSPFEYEDCFKANAVLTCRRQCCAPFRFRSSSNLERCSDGGHQVKRRDKPKFVLLP